LHFGYNRQKNDGLQESDNFAIEVGALSFFKIHRGIKDLMIINNGNDNRPNLLKISKKLAAK